MVGLACPSGAANPPDAVVGAEVPAVGGLRSRKAAAAVSSRASAPRIHHLYFDGGSGVLMGFPMPPPGWLPGCAPVSACEPLAAPCASRGIDPVPETVNSISLPGTAFLIRKVWIPGSSCTDLKGAPEPAVKVMLLGRSTATLSAGMVITDLKLYLPLL